MTIGNTKVVVNKFNVDDPAAGLELVHDGTVPEPQAGEVRVRVTTRPVHPADVLSLQGMYGGFTPKSLPAVPGLEGIGVVDANGSGCEKFNVGQRVMLFPAPAKDGRGTWQQYLCVNESALVALPDDLSDEVAAQILVNPVSAWGMLQTLAAPQGEYVLQSAAASVLGRMFIQFAKHIGVKTINVVRRREQFDDLKAIGADEVICSGDEDVVQRVRDITGGKGAWGAIDAVGGETTGMLAKSVRDGGTVLVYGFLSGWTLQTDIADVLYRNVRVHGFWLNIYIGELGAKAQNELQHVINMLRKGIVQPFSGQKFKLEDAAAAVAETRKSGRGGKCFLVS